MSSILVTGFTGNVGYEVVKALKEKGASITCAVRNVEKAKEKFGSEYEYAQLDLNEKETFAKALHGVKRLFLMYPPTVTDKQALPAFLQQARISGVEHVVYLSIKDVQYMPFIPHFHNEKAIRKSGIPYTFLRAGYFMQNLNMFLLDELKQNSRIFVSAGKGKTSFVDVRDIAEVAALALLEGNPHFGKSYVLTGNEALDFFQVAEMMSRILGKNMTYTSPSVKQFQQAMQEKGIDPQFVQVVTGIHLATKLGFAKGITQDIDMLLKREPLTLEKYIYDYQQYWK